MGLVGAGGAWGALVGFRGGGTGCWSGAGAGAKAEAGTNKGCWARVADITNVSRIHIGNSCILCGTGLVPSLVGATVSIKLSR